MNRVIKVISVLCVFVAGARQAHACPDVAGLPDVNCDGSAVVVVIGDSLAYGVGDSKNDGKGGYVLRAQAKFPEASVINRGIPGLKTVPLLQKLTKAFKAPEQSEFAQDLLSADLVVFDVGRNDRWLMGEPVATLRNIKKARALVESKVKELRGSNPLQVVAVLMYPNRGSQGPWVKELDQLIIDSHTESHPADLRFDKVSKRLLSPDNIHPTSKGYVAMSKVFIEYLLKDYPKHVANRG